MTASPAPSPSAIDRRWRRWPARVPPTLLLHIAAAIVLLVDLWRPIHDSDLLWQLRTGELILDTHSLPDREPFLAGQQDEPFTPVAWAGQAAYALLRRLGGWPLLHVADGLLWVGGLAAAAWAARRTGAGPWATAAALVLANYAAYSSVSTRPQTFGLLGMGLLVALVRGGRPGWRMVAVGAALLVAWQNFHPSAAVGGAYLAGVAAVGWGRWLLRRQPAPWAVSALVLATPAAMLATPAGIRIVEVSRYNAEASRWMGVNEWLPLWELELAGDTRIEAWVGLAALAVLLAWRGRRTRLEDLVPALLLAGMALVSYRFVMFWAVAALPVWAACLSRGTPAPARPLGCSGWAAVVGGWAAAVVVPSVVNPSHLADYFPFEPVARLKAQNLRGVVYTDAVWAGLVIDAGYPNLTVTHDGRYYLRRLPEWEAYHAAARGEVPVADLDRRWRPVAFVLRVTAEDGLIARLRREPGWVLLAEDKGCVVFVRDPAYR